MKQLPADLAPEAIAEAVLDRVRVGSSWFDCWPWQANIEPKGYGRIVLRGRVYRAHRIAYQMAVGPIPTGLTLDHLCRNRACVNPLHLEPVTTAVNTLRGESFSAVNAKKTHCVYGHPFDNANTLPRVDGQRRCRACNAAELRRRRLRDRIKVVTP